MVTILNLQAEKEFQWGCKIIQQKIPMIYLLLLRAAIITWQMNILQSVIYYSYPLFNWQVPSI